MPTYIILPSVPTLKLDCSPNLPQAIPGDTGVGPEVLGLDVVDGEDHALCVAVLVNINNPDSATRIHRQVLSSWALPKLHPVVDRPGGGLHLALDGGLGPGGRAHELLLGQ